MQPWRKYVNSAETDQDFAVFISNRPCGDKVADIAARIKEQRSLYWTPGELSQTERDKLIDFAAYALAKVAPTSLVFGVWDSRDTQAKLPRLIASSIRAFDVRNLTRSAVYIPPLDYTELDVFSEEDKAKAEGNNKSALAQRGFVHNPASGAHGGVIADGGVRRDGTLGLAALRHLHAGKDANKTLSLRRYILGLSLIAFIAPTENGVEDVLSHASAGIADTNGAPALADQGFHDDEDPLRLAAGLFGDTVFVEVVDRITFSLTGFLLFLLHDLPGILVTQGQGTDEGEQVRFT